MIADLTLLAARVVLGKSMAAHGAQKAFGWFGGPGPEAAAGMFAGLGFRPAAPFVAAASWNEIVSGELIAWGLGGPLGPAMLIAGMLVAALSVHAKNGYFAAKNGVEVPVIYSAAALTLASTGYGKLSLDHAFGLERKLRHPVVTTLALAGAIAGGLAILNLREIAREGPATPTYQGKNSPLPRAESPRPNRPGVRRDPRGHRRAGSIAGRSTSAGRSGSFACRRCAGSAPYARRRG